MGSILLGLAALIASLALLTFVVADALLQRAYAALELAEFQHRMLVERRLRHRKIECDICTSEFVYTLPEDYEPGNEYEVSCPNCQHTITVEP